MDEPRKLKDDERAALQAALADLYRTTGAYTNATDEAIWRAACAFTWEQAAKVCQNFGDQRENIAQWTGWRLAEILRERAKG